MAATSNPYTRYGDLFDTLPACKMPDQSSSLAQRAIEAQMRMPTNAAHLVNVAQVADESVRRQYRSDELVHGFARSRTDCNNPVQTFRSELGVAPMYWPKQWPYDISRDMADQRVQRFNQIAPVKGGYNMARSMGPK